MRQAFFKIFFLGLLISLNVSAKEILVLVPGFFNSFAPEYFSQDVIRPFQAKGFKVYVANNLNPIGTIEDNGVRLENYMAAVEKAEGQRVNFNIVGHSAGGLYALFVANRQKFSIKNIVTVATPFKGVEFLQAWMDDFILFKAITDLAHLDGLKQLTPSGVQKFIASIRVAPQTRIVAFGGYQNESLDVWNARNISAPLLVTSHFISGKSDGIVGYDSAIGLGSVLTTQNTRAVQLRNPQYFIALEHWEQTLDSRAFIFLGIRNTDYIAQEQQRFFTGVANYLIGLK